MVVCDSAGALSTDGEVKNSPKSMTGVTGREERSEAASVSVEEVRSSSLEEKEGLGGGKQVVESTLECSGEVEMVLEDTDDVSELPESTRLAEEGDLEAGEGEGAGIEREVNCGAEGERW